MAIPREYSTSNPAVRDALAEIPVDNGIHTGEFVAPDYPIDAETVDTVSTAEHKLNLDDLRSEDAEAKAVRFETGETGTVSIVERALKTTIGTRKIEEAGMRGVDVVAERLSYLRDDILDAKEYRIAQLVMNPANYQATHKAAGLDFKTIDFVDFVDEKQEVIVKDGRYAKARYGLFGKRAWRYARQNPEFREFAGGSDERAGSKDLTLVAFAEFVGLDEVRIGDFMRVIGNGTEPTQFWTEDAFLLFAQQKTLSNRTLAQTAVCPYGGEFGVAEGTLVDARTVKLATTDELTEAGAYHRYRTLLLNADLAFLAYGIVNA